MDKTAILRQVPGRPAGAVRSSHRRCPDEYRADRCGRNHRPRPRDRTPALSDRLRRTHHAPFTENVSLCLWHLASLRPRWLLAALPSPARSRAGTISIRKRLMAKRRLFRDVGAGFREYAAGRMGTITSSPRLLRPCRFTTRRESASVRFPVNPRARPKARRWCTANRSMWIGRAASPCAIAAQTP
jgi:hypothetical protein